jgi:hypothetical protein
MPASECTSLTASIGMRQRSQCNRMLGHAWLGLPGD